MPSPSLLSEHELQVVTDREFLLTKKIVMDKIYNLLGEVELELNRIIDIASFPEGILVKSGKISRGENYLNLPYMILDYPRAFYQQDIFAFRTMFWWGHDFSSTLHLSGKYLKVLRPALIERQELIRSSDCYVCVNPDPWQFHHQPTNYLPAQDISESDLSLIIGNKPFIKLSRKWSIAHYQQLSHVVPDCFLEFCRWTGLA